MRYGDKIAVVAYVAFLAVLVFWVLDQQVIWLGLRFFVPPGMAMVAIGIGLRRIYERRAA